MQSQKVEDLLWGEKGREESYTRKEYLYVPEVAIPAVPGGGEKRKRTVAKRNCKGNSEVPFVLCRRRTNGELGEKND